MFADFDWIGAFRSSPIMIALAACSVLTLAIALERIFYFRQRGGNADKLLALAAGLVRQKRLGAAIELCQSNSHPVGVVAAEVLRGPDPTAADAEERMQIALSRQKLLLERNLGTLGTMAAVAPLIGLLGTVWGIMRAFHDMAQTGSAAPSVVAAGVAEALLTTAAGLIIAVPAVMLYNHLSRRLNVALTVAENHARTLRSLAAAVAAGAIGDHRSQPHEAAVGVTSGVGADPLAGLVPPIEDVAEPADQPAGVSA
jgi:biopolymer transport protein ExbB